MKHQAVLFDCDGVLVDSEAITNRVLHRYLNDEGWALSEADCMRIFIGKMVRSETALIEANIGRSIDDEWMAVFYERRNIALREELLAIPDSVLAVQAAHQAFNGNIACASGADMEKVLMQLQKVALAPYFKHILSGHDCKRNKPFPDVYLKAASALETDISRCIVIEDSITGVTSGASAGAEVWAYCPENAHFSEDQLQLAGAKLCFKSMKDLSRLFLEH